MKFKIPQHIQTLQPYIAGKPIDELRREKKLDRIVKLASNENPLGSSPKGLAAAIRSLSITSRYVDPGGYSLIQALSKFYNKPADQIIAGAGTDSLISYMVKALTEETDEILTAESTFIGIYVSTRKHNRNLKTIKLKDYGFDLEKIADSITPKTRLIFLANANNPTGTIFTKTQFEQFMTRVPSDVFVVLDEAYFNYSSHLPDYPNGLEYNYDNLIVTRTMSKDYGLAGLRIGFAFAHPEIIHQLYKVKLPFEPSLPAQWAGVAALEDAEFVTKTLELNRRMLLLMSDRFAKLGIRQVPSASNFILLLMPSEEFAFAFNNACLDHGLIVRHVKSFGIPNGIRINTGTEDETAFALDIVESVFTKLFKLMPEAVLFAGAKG
ncbi:MAG: histidinol-phosphate transaminase [candidate division Zixibacteria bacterium]|nr:histidinol-phosphate transaminase [candidate division Zixibacteria bacterium]